MRRFLEWWLDRVPYCLRSTPFLRKYYWQPEEIEEIKRQVKRLERSFMENDLFDRSQ